MLDRIINGPYRILRQGDGERFPWYMIPFDKKGQCMAPSTCEHLLKALNHGEYTDVFLFSHGWNNDWKAATKHYEHFVDSYTHMCKEHNLRVLRDYHPLLVGIFWPSTTLLLPWEEGPKIAALTPGTQPCAEEEQQWVQNLADEIAEEQRERFYTLARSAEKLSLSEALELAYIIMPLYEGQDELPDSGQAPTAEDLVKLWCSASSLEEYWDDDFEDFGLPYSYSLVPAVAGVLNLLDPRHVVRLTTVLHMKDRAGVVGAHGVGDLLRDMLTACDAHLHLIGHSYGSKVLLSAVCYQPLPRKVNSLLLLQGAVSHLCFARNVLGDGRPGGYRATFERVEQPILATFSSHDFPLTRVFHLAVRRSSDLGERRIAGAPSRYAALGGFGPGGCDEECCVVSMKNIGEKYEELDADMPLYGLNGVKIIKGHGDISNPSTWWALFNQVAYS